MFGAGVIFVSVGCVSSVDVSEDPEKKTIYVAYLQQLPPGQVDYFYSPSALTIL